MGTSCVVRFIDECGKPFYAFYKHYDGHSFIDNLRNFYKDLVVVNELSGNANEVKGINDLAAVTIAKFKKGPGDIYIISVDEKTDYVDYVYEVSCDEQNKIVVKRVSG